VHTVARGLTVLYEWDQQCKGGEQNQQCKGRSPTVEGEGEISGNVASLVLFILPEYGF